MKRHEKRKGKRNKQITIENPPQLLDNLISAAGSLKPGSPFSSSLKLQSLKQNHIIMHIKVALVPRLLYNSLISKMALYRQEFLFSFFLFKHDFQPVHKIVVLQTNTHQRKKQKGGTSTIPILKSWF